MAPPKKTGKEEKKVEEVREEIGVFVFPDGSRYDGQFVRRVTPLEDISNNADTDNKKGGKGGGNNNNNANNDNKGGTKDNNQGEDRHFNVKY